MLCSRLKVASTYAAADATTPGTKNEMVMAVAGRHRSWLSKHVVKGQRDGWRPRLPKRAAAAKWIKMLDNQVRVATCFGGLEHFRYQEDDAVWAPSKWRLWPSITTAADQGSDGVCAVHALLFKPLLRVNLTALGRNLCLRF